MTIKCKPLEADDYIYYSQVFQRKENVDLVLYVCFFIIIYAVLLC